MLVVTHMDAAEHQMEVTNRWQITPAVCTTPAGQLLAHCLRTLALRSDGYGVPASRRSCPVCYVTVVLSDVTFPTVGG